MGARVIHLAEVRGRRPSPKQASVAQFDDASSQNKFHFWAGATGRRYVHTVYSLIECPELATGNILLVYRDAQGRRSVLAVDHLAERAPSLNLAEIRHRAARLGANEIHVHLLAENAHQARLVEVDLRAAHASDASHALVAGVRH